MAGLIDVVSLIDDLLREGIAPEELIIGSIRELHYLEDHPLICYNIGLKNRIRTIIAHSKILYDFDKRMQLARAVLLHKVKLLEVRDEDNKIEISVLRGSSSEEDSSKLDARLDDVSWSLLNRLITAKWRGPLLIARTWSAPSKPPRDH